MKHCSFRDIGNQLIWEQPIVWCPYGEMDISTIFYDLIIYLISSNRKNIQIFKVTLEQVCKMEWDSRIQDECALLNNRCRKKYGICTSDGNGDFVQDSNG